MYEQEKNLSKKDSTKGESIITTAEKAQYEVFSNGTIPREKIEKWIKNDLRSVASLVHGILSDEALMVKVVDHYYSAYQRLHLKDKENELDNKPR